ncbi:transcriptional regulator [Bacillus sp. FJAT-18019]|uniref:Transcriptional regulator n=1 Tax=Paenibacillus solani TaxID=1705565 RepID=A0A0M1N2S7_9BACL|nr:TetR/AcrR family transcriptional regulator [Paenibacillus solani]KOP69083.1 transcriptional regulator [Bacillus sp. FJAT-18019]KOR76472.1 transcriptional regulator [Paenibacillus solani]
MKKKPHVDSKKKDILQAAMKLFAEKGVDGVSVKEIGAEAGVTDAAIYKHFTNKDAVAAEAFEEYCGRYTRLVDDYAARPGAFGERLSSLVTRVLVSYDEDKYGLLLLSQHHELFTEVLLSRGRQPLDALQDLLEQAVNKGDIPPQNTRLTAVLIIGAFTQLAVSTMQGELEEPLSLLANEVTAHLLALIGLGKGPG